MNKAETSPHKARPLMVIRGEPLLGLLSKGYFDRGTQGVMFATSATRGLWNR